MRHLEELISLGSQLQELVERTHRGLGLERIGEAREAAEEMGNLAAVGFAHFELMKFHLRTLISLEATGRLENETFERLDHQYMRICELMAQVRVAAWECEMRPLWADLRLDDLAHALEQLGRESQAYSKVIVELATLVRAELPEAN